MTELKTVFICENIGMNGTTECHVRKNQDGKFEARMGFSVLGATEMDESGYQAATLILFMRCSTTVISSVLGIQKKMRLTQ